MRWLASPVEVIICARGRTCATPNELRGATEQSLAMVGVAKRRSRTRVGKDRPRPTPVGGVPPVVPLVSYRPGAPVLFQGRVYRVLESSAGQRVVQEWSAGYWMPSLLALFELRDARVASANDLAVHQVPASDQQGATSPRAWSTPTLTPLPHQHGVARQRKVHA